jgi:hypothetical protein
VILVCDAAKVNRAVLEDKELGASEHLRLTQSNRYD